MKYGTRKAKKASARRRRKWREERTISKHEGGRFPKKGAQAARKKARKRARVTSRRNRGYGGRPKTRKARAAARSKR